jgi:hypothetical protein
MRKLASSFSPRCSFLEQSGVARSGDRKAWIELASEFKNLARIVNHLDRLSPFDQVASRDAIQFRGMVPPLPR